MDDNMTIKAEEVELEDNFESNDEVLEPVFIKCESQEDFISALPNSFANDPIAAAAPNAEDILKKSQVQTNFECKICTKRFKTRMELKHHKKTHLTTIECEYCQKSLNKYYIKQHVQQKHACALCGKAFVQKLDLKSHLETFHENSRDHHPELEEPEFQDDPNDEDWKLEPLAKKAKKKLSTCQKPSENGQSVKIKRDTWNMQRW